MQCAAVGVHLLEDFEVVDHALGVLDVVAREQARHDFLSRLQPQHGQLVAQRMAMCHCLTHNTLEQTGVVACCGVGADGGMLIAALAEQQLRVHVASCSSASADASEKSGVRLVASN